MKKSKEKPEWDSTKIVDNSLLVEKSPFAPVFKFFSKILFGILLSAIVFLATTLSQAGYLVLFQGLSDQFTDYQQEGIQPPF